MFKIWRNFLKSLAPPDPYVPTRMPSKERIKELEKQGLSEKFIRLYVVSLNKEALERL